MTYDHWKTTEAELFDDSHQSGLEDMSREELIALVQEQEAHIAKVQRLNDEERQTIEELVRSMRRAADMLSICRDELRKASEPEDL
jgi:hypothetical protein